MVESDNSAEFFDAVDDFSGVAYGGKVSPKVSSVLDGLGLNQEHYYEETKEQMPENEEDFFFIKKEPEQDRFNQEQLIEIEIDRPASSMPKEQEKSWLGHEKSGSMHSITREELKVDKQKFEQFDESSGSGQQSQFSFPDLDGSESISGMIRPLSTSNQHKSNRDLNPISSTNLITIEQSLQEDLTVLSEENYPKKKRTNITDDLGYKSRSNQINNFGNQLDYKKRISTRLINKEYSDLTNLRHLHTLKVADGKAIWVIKFRNDGQFFATGGHDGILRVWKVQPCF